MVQGDWLGEVLDLRRHPSDDLGCCVAEDEELDAGYLCRLTESLDGLDDHKCAHAQQYGCLHGGSEHLRTTKTPGAT